jgi:hypothetical protein
MPFRIRPVSSFRLAGVRRARLGKPAVTGDAQLSRDPVTGRVLILSYLLPGKVSRQQWGRRLPRAPSPLFEERGFHGDAARRAAKPNGSARGWEEAPVVGVRVGCRDFGGGRP